MFWIALELSIPKIGFYIILSLTVKELKAFKLDGVAESDNIGMDADLEFSRWGETMRKLHHEPFFMVVCKGYANRITLP